MYTVYENEVRVLGYLWSGPLATYTYKLDKSDIESIRNRYTEAGGTPFDNMGAKPNIKRLRAAAEQWLNSGGAGDFETVVDFSAILDDILPNESVIDWADEENEMQYNDIMFPVE